MYIYIYIHIFYIHKTSRIISDNAANLSINSWPNRGRTGLPNRGCVAAVAGSAGS